MTDASDTEIEAVIEAVIDEPAAGGPTVTAFAASEAPLVDEPDEPAATEPPAPARPAAPTLDLEQIERDLEGVAMALARLDDGTYWTDEVTGEPLVDELLVADPVARRNR